MAPPLSSRRLLAVLFLTLALGGSVGACARKGDDAELSAAPDPNARTFVRVQNQGFLDHVIYVSADDGQRFRIGTAMALNTTTLQIPRPVMGGRFRLLRFLADPIGGARTPVSEQIAAEPGDVIDLQIPAQ